MIDNIITAGATLNSGVRVQGGWEKATTSMLQAVAFFIMTHISLQASSFTDRVTL
jgi:hypothetical protein